MASRTLQAPILGLVVLALTVMAAGEAGADPAARDNWVSDDGNIKFDKLGADWRVSWTDTAKKNAGIALLKEIKTTAAARVFQHKQDPKITVTLGAKEAVIANPTDRAFPPAGRVKGSWK